MTCIKYTPQVLLSSTARLDTWNYLSISVCMPTLCHTDCDSLVMLLFGGIDCLIGLLKRSFAPIVIEGRMVDCRHTSTIGGRAQLDGASQT
jgi:hypothetical protein